MLISDSFTSVCKYWQNKHGEWLCTCLCIFRKQIHLYSHNYDLNCHTVHSKCINDQTLRSDIFLPKCPTNVRQIWESTLSKSDYLVGHFGRTWEWILKDFFFTFLEVNMSNILWSMRICKRTFFPVCKMCGYVNTLVYFYLAPYSRQER